MKLWRETGVSVHSDICISFWLWSPLPFIFSFFLRFFCRRWLSALCLNLNLDRMYSFDLQWKWTNDKIRMVKKKKTGAVFICISVWKKHFTKFRLVVQWKQCRTKNVDDHFCTRKKKTKKKLQGRKKTWCYYQTTKTRTFSELFLNSIRVSVGWRQDKIKNNNNFILTEYEMLPRTIFPAK